MHNAFGISRDYCSLVAARTQCVEFDTDYRKAPEHPFPSAIQNAEDVCAYIADYLD